MSDARDVQVLTDPLGPYRCTGCNVYLDLAGHKPFSAFTCPSCHMEMQVPARLGGFLLVELLGIGGMGGAFRARDESLNRDVAIKVMRKRYGDDPAFVETFRHEAQAAARLNHPNVVQIHSFGEAKGQPYIVMELVRGGSLDRLIAAGKPLDQIVVMRIGAEIAAALQHGYQSQLVHGDIKPENILLDERGAAKLVDFGIAQLAGCGDSKEVWGTPYYVAPEKVRRQRADCRADIYSLGGTLFHALTRKPPFDGPDATAVVKARFLRPAPPLRELRPDIDPEIETIVARMLQLEPAMRYPTYESLLSDMRRYLDRVGPTANSTKKVLLKKKGADTGQVITTTTGSVSGSAAPTPSAAPVHKSGRIVIQRGAAARTRMTNATVKAAENENAVAKPESRMPGWAVALLAGFGLLALALVTAGGISLIKHNSSRQPPQAQNPTPSSDAQQQEREKLIASLQEQVRAGEAQATAYRTNAEEGGKLVQASMKAVRDLLLPEAADQLAPTRPARQPRPAPAPAIAPTATNAASTNASAPEAAAPAAPPPAAAEPEKEPEGMPDAVVKLRDMHRRWYRLETIAADAADATEALKAEVATAQGSTNSVDALARSTEPLCSALFPFLPNRRADDEAQRILANLKQGQRDVQAMVPALAEAKLKRERDAARQRAEQERQELERQAEEARKSKIAAEVGTVQAKEREVAELLHKHAYNDARRQLRTLLSQLDTEEGRKALDTAIERANRLENLRDFLIERLPGFQHPREGWKIDSADKAGLTVNNKGVVKEVPWAEVDDVRMVFFIRHSLMTEEQTRALKLRPHVHQLVGAALYCRSFIGGSKVVQDLADKMLARAVEMLPDAKLEIARLMPDAAAKTADAATDASTNKVAGATP